MATPPASRTTATDDLDLLMSFGDHLDELRRRLLWALAAPLPLAIVAFFFSNTLLAWLLLPLTRVLASRDLPVQIQQLSPPEMLLTQLKISVIAALIISAPWIVYQLWLFIKPGLLPREQRFVYLLLPGSAIMTALGVTLMYVVMLPLMLQFLVAAGQTLDMSDAGVERDLRVEVFLQQSQSIEFVTQAPSDPQLNDAWLLWPDMTLWVAVANKAGDGVDVLQVPANNRNFVEQQYQLSATINFILLLFLAIVIAFQLPLVLLLLGWLGLASPDWLAEQRKYALFGCAIVGATITPPDILSMVMMMAPLYGLFEFGVLLMRIAPAERVAEGSFFKRRKKRNAAVDNVDSPGAEIGPDNPDKPDPDAADPIKPVQAEDSVARTDERRDRASESERSDSDESTDGTDEETLS